MSPVVDVVARAALAAVPWPRRQEADEIMEASEVAVVHVSNVVDEDDTICAKEGGADVPKDADDDPISARAATLLSLEFDDACRKSSRGLRSTVL